MAKGTMDQFAQYLAITIVESAANTLTFAQVQTGGFLFERRAMIIHRIAYLQSVATAALLLDGADRLEFGLSVNNTLTTIAWTDPNVIDLIQQNVFDIGTPASSQLHNHPIVSDFSAMPGGGLIIPAFPIFGFIRGTSIAAAATVVMRAYYTIKELEASEFIELVEASRIIT